MILKIFGPGSLHSIKSDPANKDQNNLIRGCGLGVETPCRMCQIILDPGTHRIGEVATSHSLGKFQVSNHMGGREDLFKVNICLNGLISEQRKHGNYFVIDFPKFPV